MSVAIPILPPVGRFEIVLVPNTVDQELWNVATGLLVPIPNLLLLLSQYRALLSCDIIPPLPAKRIDPGVINDITGADINVFVPTNA